MKTRFLLTTILLSTLLTFANAKTAGTEGGGGGDASEARVNEIRSDLLKWVNNGGAKELVLPIELSYGEYADLMTNILQPKKVIIEFSENKVLVNKIEKTCKGFFEEISSRPHILCNISRFKNTSDSEQYKLIHHEYAGLVKIENNVGSASDYAVSTQITEFLTLQSVLKLAVKKVDSSSGLEDSLSNLPSGTKINFSVLPMVLPVNTTTAYACENNLGSIVMSFPQSSTLRRFAGVDIETILAPYDRRVFCAEGACGSFKISKTSDFHVDMPNLSFRVHLLREKSEPKMLISHLKKLIESCGGTFTLPEPIPYP